MLKIKTVRTLPDPQTVEKGCIRFIAGDKSEASVYFMLTVPIEELSVRTLKSFTDVLSAVRNFKPGFIIFQICEEGVPFKSSPIDFPDVFTDFVDEIRVALHKATHEVCALFGITSPTYTQLDLARNLTHRR